MHCRTCDYPLWNLTTRTCPECGAEFRPTDFAFVPNSVRYCCPQCRLAYYGTASNGHLVPDQFTCAGCGQAITMNECVLLPAEGVAEEQTKPEVYPWFDARRRWRIGSWFTMMGRCMFTPSQVGRTVPRSAPMGFLFGLLVSSTTAFVFLMSAMIPLMLGLMVSSGGLSLLIGLIAVLLFGLLQLVQFAVLLSLWIVFAHLFLCATGRVSEGIARTGQGICYTAPILLPVAVPCLGLYLIVILLPWWTISAGAAIAGAHGVAVWRGIIASVLAMVITGALGVLLLALIV